MAIIKHETLFADYKGEIIDVPVKIELEHGTHFHLVASYKGKIVGTIAGEVEDDGYATFMIATKGTDFSPLTRDLMGIGQGLLKLTWDVTKNEFGATGLKCVCDGSSEGFFRKVGMTENDIEILLPEGSETLVTKISLILPPERIYILEERVGAMKKLYEHQRKAVDEG